MTNSRSNSEPLPSATALHESYGAGRLHVMTIDELARAPASEATEDPPPLPPAEPVLTIQSAEHPELEVKQVMSTRTEQSGRARSARALCARRTRAPPWRGQLPASLRSKTVGRRMRLAPASSEILPVRGHRSIRRASVALHPQPIVLVAKPGDLCRRVRDGMRGRRRYRAQRRPRIPPSASIAQLRSIEGEMPSSLAIWLNGRPLLTSRAIASCLNSSVK